MESEQLQEYLGLGVGDTRYAVRLDQVGTVHELRTVTRVPCKYPGFDGLTTVQGQLVAVYDLAAWVNATTKTSARRWLLVCREDHQVGFAVDTVDGYLRIAASRVVATADAQQRQTSLRQALDTDTGPRLVVDFARLLTSLRNLAGLEGANT